MPKDFIFLGKTQVLILPNIFFQKQKIKKLLDMLQDRPALGCFVFSVCVTLGFFRRKMLFGGQSFH